jgi:hypothetical protein
MAARAWRIRVSGRISLRDISSKKRKPGGQQVTVVRSVVSGQTRTMASGLQKFLIAKARAKEPNTIPDRLKAAARDNASPTLVLPEMARKCGLFMAPVGHHSSVFCPVKLRTS